MGIVAGDFETYYTQEYSLRRMSELDYILDPRFQTIMCSIKVDQAPSEVFVGHRAVARKLASFDWNTNCWLSHNTRFDGAILAWHYGHVPALYLDTLSMARATTHAVLGRSSLAKVSEYLDMPPKGDEVVRAMGKRLEDFAPDELQAYAEYCIRDNDNCRAIFDRLRPVLSAGELRLIDLVLRMFIIPQVLLEPNALALHLNQVKAEKAAILARVAHIDPATFSSNIKFAALLETYGVEVPRKISATTGQETFALAKNDRAFKELCSDPDQSLDVQALLAARLNSKSTLDETRAKTLLDQSLKVWPPAPWPTLDIDQDAWDAARSHSLALPSRGTGWAVVPLKFYGARTGRLSGDGGTNWQNFRRGSPIRAGVTAPPGYRVVHRDASQIEARMVAWLAGCTALTTAFAQKRDVYSEFASGVYHKHVTKADTGERFVGKTGILGLGYGCGPPKFRHMLFLGNGGVSVNIDEEEARRIVYHYRSTYPEIPELWRDGDLLLAQIMFLSRPVRRGNRNMRGHTFKMDEAKRKPLFRTVEPGHNALWLPNGMCIAYPRLRHERMVDNSFQMVYDDPQGGWRKIYGAKCIENVSQALSRIIVTDIMLRMYELTGYHPFLSTHDSLDYCVPEEDVRWWDEELERQFAMRPAWAPDIPLASDGGWGRTLLEAERAENM